MAVRRVIQAAIDLSGEADIIDKVRFFRISSLEVFVMNVNSPADIVSAYSRSGRIKANKETKQLIVLAVMAGMTIAFGSAVSNTAVHSITNVSIAKIISGFIFPFGLCIIMLMGMELFTGNIMIAISVMNKEAKLAKMFRNWFLVYLGNFIGAAIISAGTSFFGQLNYSDGQLAVYSMKLAITKIDQPFSHALVSGILANLLVCTAVLCYYSSKETISKLIGCYMPVAFFVIAGFEHSVANMYYLSTAFFAKANPIYASQAVAAGLNLEQLTVPNALISSFLPVTIGNIIGGLIVSYGMWYAHKQPMLVGEEVIVSMEIDESIKVSTLPK